MEIDRRTTKTHPWTILILACASAAGCQDKNAARVVALTPHGEARSSELREGVRIKFDRPVVPASALGATLLPPPVVLKPAIPGTVVWLDPQTLVFTPGQTPRPSTRYEVSLDAGALKKTQVSVAPWSGDSFVFERIRVRRFGFSAPGSDFQPVSPLVNVVFTDAVAPTEAAKSCGFISDGGKKIDARLGSGPAETQGTPDPDSAEEGGDSSSGTATVVRLSPVEKLEAGAAYKLRCRAGLKPAAGGEGLAKDEDGAFRTYGALKVVKVTPDGNDVLPDDAVIKIEFSTPVEPEQVREYVNIRAEFGNQDRSFVLEANAQRTVYSWKGNLEPKTRYGVEVKKDLRDVFGQRLADETSHWFYAGDAGPRLRMERGIYAVERSHGKYGVWTRNLPSFELACARIPETKLATLLTGPVDFDSWYYGAEEKEIDYKALGVKPQRRSVKAGGEKNKWHDASLDLAALCGGGAAAPRAPAAPAAPADTTPPATEATSPVAGTPPGGVYLLEVSSKVLQKEGKEHWPTKRVLANVTDLGLLAKVGNAASLVWVVRLSNGEAVPGVTVRIRDSKGKVRFTGTTGADGTVSAPGATKLLDLAAGAPKGSGDDHNEDYEDWDSRGERRVFVTAQSGDDLALLDTNWNSGIQAWNFSVNEARGGADVRVRGFLQSDRGLYRPGEVVHLRGLVRAIDVAGKMRVPAKAKKAHLVIEDPRGKTLVDEDVAITAFGGFHRDLELDGEARLGDYQVKGTVLGQTFSDKFAVEEYRPRSFEVKLTTPKKHVFFGQKLAFTVAGNYLYGAPLKGGTLKWGIRRRAHTPSFPELPGYTFQDLVKLWDEGSYWSRYEERSFSSFVQDGEKPLDDKGQARIAARDDDKQLAGPQDYLIEATVTDSRGEGVTTTQAVVMHRSAVYLGLRTEEFVQAVDKPFAVQTVALTPEGKRRSVTGAELTLTRTVWSCPGNGPCKRTVEGEPVTHKLDIPETGAAVEKITLKSPGEYQMRLKADDGRGGTALASDTIYVVGKGESFWSTNDGERMTLVASRPKYKKGDTARLIAQANLPGALALLTLERDGVMQHQVTRMESTAEALEVPIEPRFAPNVYASVTLVRGRTGPGEKGKPAFKMGMVNLEVDTSDRRLKISVDTDRPSYRPGETVTATVKVQGEDGAPVKAEVALAAADEGVLQIAGYKTPDPMPAFYAAWGLGVASSTTWNRLARVRDPADLTDDDEGEGGDAGGDEAGRVRSRFMATAYWNPALITGADGSARVTFTAPDNLTAFRVMAVAADTGERFGSGEKRFTINKPLQAMAALPRFLTMGDNLNATVVLHNNTKQPLKVTVSAQVKGPVRFTGETSQVVEIPATGSRPAVFPAMAENDGEAAFTFRALGGGENDGVLTKVPVLRPTTTETLLVGEGSTGGRAEHALKKPDGVLPGRGRLEVVLDATGLSRLDEGLAYLVGYPYGCLEQTTSKVVPMVAIGGLAGSVDLPEVNQAKLKQFVTTGLAKMLRHQHDDGGFGLWIGAPVEQHYTAFGLWGLAVAKRAGWNVDEAALKKGATWLRASLSRDKDDGYHWMGVAGSQAFALYVLAELFGDKIGPGPDAALLSKLMDQRAKLPRYGQAFLARAMSRSGRKDEARKILDELAADAGKGSGPLVIGESRSDELAWYWNSDVRTTAIVLGAFVEAAPTHAMVSRLADGLLGARSGGRWENTQENLYSLVALAELARARAASAHGSVTVTAGGKRLHSGPLGGSEVRRIALPLDEVNDGSLIVEAEGAPVYYMARLHAVRVLDDRAAQAGLTVKREYLDAETGRPVSQARIGQLVKVRLVISSPKSRAHVAVVDRLPAGLEPVLDRFQRREEDENQGRRWWWAAAETRWQSRQLHDDRVELFADVLAAGDTHHEYLTRAMSAGTFTAPGTLAEMMYKPTLNGRSTGGKLEIVRQ